MEKFKVCKLGGTGCKYWNEYDMKCKKDQYKDNPELCEMFPNMGEHTKEEIEEGIKSVKAYDKKKKLAMMGLVHNYIRR